MTDDHIILLITDHRQFGPMVAVWEVVPESKGWFVLENRLTWPVPAEYDPDRIKALHEIIAATQTMNDAEIHRQFARKGTSLKDFLGGLSEEFLQEHIRPFVDRQTDKIFRLANGHDLPLYLHDGSQRVYYESRMLMSRDPVEPWFCFTKTAEGSNYTLELFQNDRQIRLKSPGNRIICRNPCWFRAGNRLLHFPEGFDGKKTEPFLKKDTILIPATAEKKYFETFILKTLKTGQVRATGFKVQTLDPEHRMELSAEVDWQGRAILVVYFRYGDKRIMAGKSQKVFIDLQMDDKEVVFYKTERNPEWETAMISGCTAAGLVRFNENTLCLPGSQGTGSMEMYRLVEWLNAGAEFFRKEGIRITTTRAPQKFFTGTITPEIRVEPGEDWFDVKGSVFFGEFEVSFIHLRKHILEGISEFPLPWGEVAILPVEWFTRYSDLHYFSEATDNFLRLPMHHVQIIRDLGIPANEDLTDRLTQLDSSRMTQVTVPADLQAVLRPYQAEGLQWLQFLHHNRFGGCLADDMGLGKTIQTLALLLSCIDPSNPASLVIMPAFAPSLRVLEHTGLLRMTSPAFFGSVDVILTTYGTLRNDLNLFCQYKFHYIILDESQVIKNPAAQISKAVCRLEATYRLVLTGTPIENSLTDLWSQFEFLNPGLLGSLDKFQRRYARKLPAMQPDPPDSGKGRPDPGSLNAVEPIRDQAVQQLSPREEADPVAERLKRLVAPFILRRTKREAEPFLPPLTIEEWYCEMSDAQRSRYEKEKSAVRNEVLQQFETGRASETSLMVLKALIRLRQMANHPKLADPEYEFNSGKFEEIMRVAHTLRDEGHKTLIFSSFVKHLQLIASQFDLEGISYSLLTGATTRREKVVGKFREDSEQQFFLISLKAGGTGLNLTEAGYVMLLDPWWNPAAELQAINRAHRIGQDKKVIAYKFITTGTIEEKMLVLQQKKQSLSDNFLPSGNPLKDLSREQIAELFA